MCPVLDWSRFGISVESHCGVRVSDVVFVVLTVAIFVLLGLAAKGAERL
jgi:hypothetical protein